MPNYYFILYLRKVKIIEEKSTNFCFGLEKDMDFDM